VTGAATFDLDGKVVETEEITAISRACPAQLCTGDPVDCLRHEIAAVRLPLLAQSDLPEILQ
jgi:hypothetical protein